MFAAVTAGRRAAGDVADLTIGYRVPGPILDVANRLLPLTGVDATASRSVRVEGRPPQWVTTDERDLATTVVGVVAGVKHRHRLTGVVAPIGRHAALAAALEVGGLRAVDHVHELAARRRADVRSRAGEGPRVRRRRGGRRRTRSSTARPRGARLLYVAMTRAVQELALVTTRPDLLTLLTTPTSNE